MDATTLLTLVVLAMIIASNNLGTAIALGAAGAKDRRWRVLVVFGVFEFLGPLAGAFAGVWLRRVAAVGEILAPVVILLVGIVTLWSASRGGPDPERLAKAATSWRGLVLLELGLVLDNVAVGFGLGASGISPVALASAISLVAMAYAWFGIGFGARARGRWDRRALVLSGLLLILLALLLATGVL